MSTEVRKRKKLGLIVASFLVFVATFAVLLQEGAKKTVALTLDGEEVVVKTNAATIADMLNELDINFKDKDYLSHDPKEAVKDDLSLIWKPAKPVTIEMDGTPQHVWTTADSVSSLLEKQGIRLNKEDQVNVPLHNQIYPNMNIKIEKAFQVLLKDGNKDQEKMLSASTTVADFLQKQNITLGDLDRVEPSLDEEVAKAGLITITRVEKVTDVVEETIDYEIINKEDPTLAEGKKQVIKQGTEGLMKKEFEVTKENGKEVSRKLLNEDKVRESSDQIMAVGTKQKPAPVKQAAKEAQAAPVKQAAKKAQAVPVSSAPAGGKELYMNATAYTASCNGCSGVTATGIDLRSNPNAKVIAVDPSVIPLGSKVWVDGYGTAIAGDTGGAIKGNRIDLHVSSKGQAMSFGMKKVKVRILN